MYSKRPKKLSLGLYHIQIRQDEHDIVAILGHNGRQTAFLWVAICSIDSVKTAFA